MRKIQEAATLVGAKVPYAYEKAHYTYPSGGIVQGHIRCPPLTRKEIQECFPYK